MTSASSEIVAAPAPSLLRRVLRFVWGDRPWMVAFVYSPTLIAMLLDVVVRPSALARLSGGMTAVYFGSALAGSGVWGALLWFGSRLFLVRSGRYAIAARAALGVLFGGLFLPFAVFAYGGQAIYYRAFHAYVSRDSVRMGIRVRGDVVAWLSSWVSGLAVMIIVGIAVTVLVTMLVRRAAEPLSRATPIWPLLLLGLSGYCYWTDFIETRALQAAPPDACFMHGIVYTARVAITGAPPHGVTLRTPDPLPPLTPPAHRPNVVVILSESVRADALCSAKADGCDAPFLDAEVPERVALGKLTAQASGTFSACMMLWTGLGPQVDFMTAHRAPMLWELGHAVGYRTAYIASQNLLYQDLGTYLQRAGIDVQKSAVDLGDAPDVHIGAPDENATARALTFAREVPAETPYFMLVHLSNTHWPYRVDPALEPYTPHDTGPLANRQTLLNHYRNSVRLQERTVATFLRELKKDPRWDDTVVLFLSDHGEQFREHRRLHHLNNLFDEEVNIPGFLVAGEHALTPDQRAALATFAGKRTYSQDMQATIVDLFGVFDQRDKLPFGELTAGRSLLRQRPLFEPMMPMSTTSAVYEDDDPVYGVRQGELLLVWSEVGAFKCYDSRHDPGHKKPVANTRCSRLMEAARDLWPDLHLPAP
ncbi:Choline-sulfatase [Minicystis rosea]|nr:Choline-sulfatase [Minicystis rosea]